MDIRFKLIAIYLIQDNYASIKENIEENYRLL